MTAITVKATFDGSTFTIHDSVNLEPNTDYILTIEKEESKPVESPLDILRKYAGSVHGPPDWSIEHDHYIHGTPKRGINEK